MITKGLFLLISNKYLLASHFERPFYFQVNIPFRSKPSQRLRPATPGQRPGVPSPSRAHLGGCQNNQASRFLHYPPTRCTSAGRRVETHVIPAWSLTAAWGREAAGTLPTVQSLPLPPHPSSAGQGHFHGQCVPRLGSAPCAAEAAGWGAVKSHKRA